MGGRPCAVPQAYLARPGLQEGAKARRTELRAAVSETELEHARYDLQRGPRRDWAPPRLPHLRRDGAHPSHLCAVQRPSGSRCKASCST